MPMFLVVIGTAALSFADWILAAIALGLACAWVAVRFRNLKRAGSYSTQRLAWLGEPTRWQRIEVGIELGFAIGFGIGVAALDALLITAEASGGLPRAYEFVVFLATALSAAYVILNFYYVLRIRAALRPPTARTE